MAFLNLDIEPQYTIETIIIFIEFALIGFLIFMTIVLKLFDRARKKTDIMLSKAIESMISRLIYQNKAFKEPQYPILWRRLTILIPLIHKIDKVHSSGPWINIRSKIINEIILPRARAIAPSADIKGRILAAEAFCLMSDRDPANEEPILQLVNSPIPLVSLNGIYAAFKYGTEEMIDAIIMRFSKQSWLYESSSLRLFTDHIENKSHMIVNKLMTYTDIGARSVCYNILRKCKPVKITWDIKKDILSEDRDLKISAIKFIAYCDRDLAIPLLISCLEDSHLEVILVCIHRLRLLKATQSIPYLERKLEDKELWVSLSAAQALLDFGFDQKKLAKKLNTEPGQIPLKIPYTENTWW